MSAFKKVLIANRGEIAIRILRGCHQLDILAVMVHSTADRQSRAVRLADEAICIGEPEPRFSYLDGDKIIAAARACGADAIHPGYGFLAENAAFARAVADAGIVFIGPNPDAIDAMGDKINSRRRMIDAGVPVIPGISRDRFDEASLRTAAEEIGFPVMLKATAGGGGKGIRIVHEPAELWSSYERVASEAEKSFGNGTIFVEKAIEGSHHIEFQIFGDQHGNVVHMHERECSIQRRHQKVVEETPSPFMTDDLRTEMGEAAVMAARAINYDNAGTVEFLVDKNRKFYFLEVNTRLQVEHAITEEVLGLDLVVEQLHVAAGEKLSVTQDDLVARGHAIEVRICAEDPDNNYMPSIGQVVGVTLPAGPGIRIDSALEQGLDVSLYYDPMLAKLIAWGIDRHQAIARLKQALSEFKVAGLKTNIPLLGAIVRDDRFVAGNYDTAFLSDFPRPAMRPQLLQAAWVAAVLRRHTRQVAARATAPSTTTGMNPWRTLTRRKGMR